MAQSHPGLSPSTTLVLVTGANQGIGFEIAKKLATDHDDYHILMTGRRKAAVDDAADKLRHLGLSVEPLQLDVSSEESIAAAAQAVKQKFGRLDVLVNNAGTGGAGADDVTWDRPSWSSVFDTNVFGVVGVIEAFLPLLRQSVAATKRIVTISSGLGSMSLRMEGEDGPGRYRRLNSYRAYSASKAALNMAVHQYAVDFEHDPSWKINLCCPGSCSTSINKFEGQHPVEHGAINACRLATLGPDDETGTFTDVDGTVPW